MAEESLREWYQREVAPRLNPSYARLAREMVYYRSPDIWTQATDDPQRESLLQKIRDLEAEREVNVRAIEEAEARGDDDVAFDLYFGKGNDLHRAYFRAEGEVRGYDRQKEEQRREASRFLDADRAILTTGGFLTMHQLRLLLGCGHQFLWRLNREGEFVVYRIPPRTGNHPHLYVRQEDAERLMASYGTPEARALRRRPERRPALSGPCPRCGETTGQNRKGTRNGRQRARCLRCGREYRLGPKPPEPIQLSRYPCPWCGERTEQNVNYTRRLYRRMECGHCGTRYSVPKDPRLLPIFQEAWPRR